MKKLKLFKSKEEKLANKNARVKRYFEDNLNYFLENLPCYRETTRLEHPAPGLNAFIIEISVACMPKDFVDNAKKQAIAKFDEKLAASNSPEDAITAGFYTAIRYVSEQLNKDRNNCNKATGHDKCLRELGSKYIQFTLDRLKRKELLETVSRGPIWITWVLFMLLTVFIGSITKNESPMTILIQLFFASGWIFFIFKPTINAKNVIHSIIFMIVACIALITVMIL